MPSFLSAPVTLPSLAAGTSTPVETRSALALAGIIDSIGEPDFAQRGLACVNDWGAVGSWSVYRTWRDRPPQLFLSAAQGVADTTRECFGAYSDGLYKRDRSFEVARCFSRAEAGQAAVLHLRAEEVPDPAHRAAIYSRHGVLARLSIVQPEAEGSLLAINFYKHQHQGVFADGETQNFIGVAQSVLACVRKHLRLQEKSAGPTDAQPPVLSMRQRLLVQCPALTTRELDVCERLLQGMSYDGIAADLQLTLASVKTYRSRAFQRLGLHFRNELFARFMPQ